MWKDKLTLEDLVWIDPKEESYYRNRFIEINSTERILRIKKSRKLGDKQKGVD